MLCSCVYVLFMYLRLFNELSLANSVHNKMTVNNEVERTLNAVVEAYFKILSSLVSEKVEEAIKTAKTVRLRPDISTPDLPNTKC